MSQDYSRILFDPGQDYLGVLLQQGRPLMDADWNALVMQINRRTQAGSYDTFGPAVVPETTPDGFLISPIPGGFNIGRGRIYVDGLLAENHGTGGPKEWDPHLAEEFRPEPLAWNAPQPYGPSPTIPAGFPYLVYLDVWQREVGTFEDPREDGAVGTAGRLVDVAVGVDTTARLQTVWQVRTLGGLTAGMDCGTPLEEIPGWAAITAPSAGRLTTSTGVVAGEPDPCLVPPLGGYKGAENQLYRVEVHRGGAPGTATFKWSRDNASVQARVRSITGLDTLTLDSTGKDEVLRFNSGDWIEITDEARELRGTPGVLRQIALINGVNDSARTVTLATPLLAADFPVNGVNAPLGRHTRVRKWNQGGIVKRADGSTYVNLSLAGSTGEITIPADGSHLLIENGVLVAFGLATAGGLFRSGDWWVFAARANDASVEILDAAPPRGIHHHYAKLAVVTSATEADDCREIWPPDRGCCTVVVRPGESIQSAIDSLPEWGGCVCLKSGFHEIDEPLNIPLSNVILHGEAPGTRIVATTPMQFMLSVNGPGTVANVEIAHVAFEYAVSPEAFDSPMILLVYGSERIRVHHCEFIYSNDGISQLIGALLGSAEDVGFNDCLFDRCYLGVSASEGSDLVRVADNRFRGQVYEANGALPFSQYGVLVQARVGCTVEGNHFEDFLTGVRSQGHANDIAGNTILRRALPSSMDNPADYSQLQFAIDVRGENASVRDNRIDLNSQTYAGVHVEGLNARIDGNEFASAYAQGSVVGPIGVFLGELDDTDSNAADQARVSGNTFLGIQLGVVAQRTRGTRVTDNRFAGVERTGGALILNTCETAVISGNEIRELATALMMGTGRDNRVFDNEMSQTAIAVYVENERALEFTGNRVEDASFQGLLVSNVGGSNRFTGNRIAYCGWASTTASLAFAALNQSDALQYSQVSFIGNEIFDTGISPDGATMAGGVAYGIVGVLVGEWQIENNRIAYDANTTFPVREHRAVALVGLPSYTVNLGAGTFELAYGYALINGNVFHGPSQTHLVELQRIRLSDAIDLRFEKVIFSANTCEQIAPGNDALVTVQLFGSHMVVNGNTVKTPAGGFSLGFGGRPRVAVMGNHTTSTYFGVGTTVPAPFNNFNVIL